ncbi:SusC/RagA family TonB-linked outer membrane protein [Pedobacter hiemivivus]|uniref:TonB-dependent receptor n=1 Tax=Pedobacter hiemivivus TaxID=2530454 RepID=A0A4R0NIT5_9SPHI|nr:TonB-dependent receptor [Pedobacter hiemivivus]TCC99292.1 TonB-dependent receptor [Pedobacter hiemivivus]
MNFYDLFRSKRFVYRPNQTLRIMKLIIIIMTTLLMDVTASGFAQKITFSQKGASIKTIFKEITRQTGYQVVCDGDLINNAPATDVNFREASLQEVFDQFFLKKSIKWILEDKTLIISKDKLVVETGSMPRHKIEVNRLVKEIRGTVRDTVGPLPGASVSVKGKKQIGTTTDLNGKYMLDVIDESAVLVFSMVGYVTEEVPVRGKTMINVTLKAKNNDLDETVIVAFGKQKKESVIGSITTINPGELKIPSSNLTTALAGRLAGVIAYQRSGEPGRDDAEFFIRGATTFGYKKSPLILIDNMEYTTTDLARLQPDDIETFSILKDASASALYGARGANGVILITTKQGKEGKPRINARFENTISQPTRDIELANPIDYMMLHSEAALTRNPTASTIYTQSQIDNTIAGTNPIAFPMVDWQQELLKKRTINQRLNMSLSGGGQVATYFVSGTYNQDNGLLKVDPRNNFNNNIDLKYFNLRSNVIVNVSKTTKMTVRLNGGFDEYQGPIANGEDTYKAIMRTPQTQFLPYYPNEGIYKNVNHIMFGNIQAGGANNPYADLVKGYKEYSRSLMVAQLEFTQDLAFLTPGLSINGMMNTNRRSYFDVVRQYKPFWYAVSSYDKVENSYRLSPLNPEGGTNFLDFIRGGNQSVASNFHTQVAANWNKSFKAKHNVSLMSVVVMRSEGQGNAKTLQESLPSRNLGVSGRATYNYDDRYFAEFNYAYNGSERFSTSERFGFFPTIGGAWAISNEKFFKPLLPVVNKLRIRGNIGLVGNDEIGSDAERFFYLSEVEMNSGATAASFGTNSGTSRPGISVLRYENPFVTWETSRNSTFGLEVGLWNKLDIIAEYFIDHRYNILMTRASIPATMGLQAAIKANVGEVRSRSSEIQLTYNDRIGKDFTIQLRGNFTFSRNRFEAYEEPDYAQEWLYKKGQSTSQQWGYIAERLFVDEEEVRSSPSQNFGGFKVMGGDIKFRDVNNDGQVNSLDMVPIGHPTTPEIIYGFGPAMSFKNFDLNFFFQGSARSSFWIDAAATAPFVGNNQLLKVYAEDHWSEQNRNLYALWPRLSPIANANSNAPNTWFMRNGAFLRLKQVEAGYTLPKKIMQRLRVSNLRLYGSATNLFTLSKFKMWDVEMAGNGLGYPVQRVINFGIQLGL